MDAGPLRTCVGCRAKRSKDRLIRLSRRSDGTVTVGSAAPGRGAYLCEQPGCIEAAFSSGRLRRALRVDRLPEGLRQDLIRKGTDGKAKGSRGS